MKRRAALLLICLGLPGSSRSDPVAEARAHHRDFQSEGEGIVIAEVSRDGTEIGQAGNLRAGGPGVGPDTLFEIGSITKVFTGILLADAVLGGTCSLEDPVDRHLPSDLLPDDSPLRQVTLLDLATHTSGLPRLPSNLEQGSDARDPYAHYTTERLYEYLEGFDESDFEKRGETSYSNLGMGLLGHLLERISGKPYEQLLKEKVLDPLGMGDSFVQRRPGDLPESVSSRFATGHSGGREVPHWHIDALCGAGAIVSSARDLVKFAGAQLAPDLAPNLRAAMDLAAKPHRGPVGLGWFVGENGLHHDGGTGGFRSEIRISPAAKTASIRLMNGTRPATDAAGEGDFSGISGIWQGTLAAGGRELRLVLRISDDGRTVMHSLDQGAGGIPADRSVLEEGELRLAFGGLGGTYAGRPDGDRIRGTWTQNGSFPLDLERRGDLPPDLAAALSRRVAGDLSGLAGWWSGYLGGRRGLFVILEIDSVGSTAEARLYSPDQSPAPIPVTGLSFADGRLKLESDPIGASYEAGLDGDDKLTGEWRQGTQPQRLTLTKSPRRPARE